MHALKGNAPDFIFEKNGLHQKHSDGWQWYSVGDVFFNANVSDNIYLNILNNFILLQLQGLFNNQSEYDSFHRL